MTVWVAMFELFLLLIGIANGGKFTGKVIASAFGLTALAAMGWIR